MANTTLHDPVHLIGIGGTGMAPLAEICLARGIKISGSDLSANLATERLIRKGISVHYRHEANFVAEAKTVVYSSAVPVDNVEYVAAKANPEIELIHRSVLLQRLMQHQHAITIAGTHGKTTTSALIAHMLTELGLDPTAAVGGRMLNFDSYARIGKGNLFVAEADESDGSFTTFTPTIACLTNIDADHLDFYGGIAQIKVACHSYLNRTREDGCMVVGWDNRHIQDICAELSHNKLGFGTLIGSDVRLLSMTTNGAHLILDVMVERDRVKIDLPMIGKHNAQNALCAITVARALELDVVRAAESFASFRGVARRMSAVVDLPHIKVFDDYAHNPGKISSCLVAVKMAYPSAELHVVFQPHRYSRMRTMLNEFAASFTYADQVYVMDVYAAGEARDEQYTAQSIADAIAITSRVRSVAVRDHQDAAERVLDKLEKPVIIITIGAGDVWSVGQILKKELLHDAPAKEVSKRIT